MANSIEQLFRKTDNILLEVNRQYEEVRNREQIDNMAIALLASDLEYLSSLIKTLHFFENDIPKIVEEDAEANINNDITSITAHVEADVAEQHTDLDTHGVLVGEENKSPEGIDGRDHLEYQNIAIGNREEEISEESISNTSVYASLPNVEDEVGQLKEEAKADEVTPKTLTINELIQKQKQEGVNITQQFQTSTTQEKVVDLKTIISLNDKLLFIKDLFNGYSLAYSEALELLNRFSNYGEADAFLQTNYALKNGWSSKPQTVEKFYSLLRKKFH